MKKYCKNTETTGYALFCTACHHNFTSNMAEYSPTMKCPCCYLEGGVIIMDDLDEPTLTMCEMERMGFVKREYF